MAQRAQVLMAVTCPREICTFGTVHLPAVPLEALVVIVLVVGWQLLRARQRPPLVMSAPDPSTVPADEARLVPEPACNWPAPVHDTRTPVHEALAPLPSQNLRRRSAPPMPSRTAVPTTAVVTAVAPSNDGQAQPSGGNLRRRSAPPLPPRSTRPTPAPSVTAHPAPTIGHTMTANPVPAVPAPVPAPLAARENPACTPSINQVAADDLGAMNCEPSHKIKIEACGPSCKENRAPDTMLPHDSAVAELMAVDSPEVDEIAADSSTKKSGVSLSLSLSAQSISNVVRCLGLGICLSTSTSHSHSYAHTHYHLYLLL